MAQGYTTEQENFWAGEFGDEYISRNRSEQLLTAKTVLWGRMLRCASNVRSIMELGCNIGLNLKAINRLSPSVRLAGIEINEKAASEAARIQGASITCGSILEKVDQAEQFDLTFTSGVLIHIHPDFLSMVYQNLFNNTRRYVLLSEYYNPTPVSVPYRGNLDRLFKRDFAGEMIDRFGLRLVDYGSPIGVTIGYRRTI